MSRYAKNTKVESRKSVEDIEKELSRFGATGFMYARKENRAAIAFEYDKRSIRMNLPLPGKDEYQFKYTLTGQETVPNIQTKKWKQAIKQKWRALLLLVKAKLVGVEDGISTFETEFLPYLVTENGKTIAEEIVPNLDKIGSQNIMRFLPNPQTD